MTERLTDEEIESLIEWLEGFPYEKEAAVVRQLLEERRWRPISEAPKDGTIVDLLHKDGVRTTDCWWDDDDELWAGIPDEAAAGVTHFIRAPYTYPPQDGED